MEREPFEKEHPSLIEPMKKWIAVFCKASDSYQVRKDIHKTQLDKQKANDVIDRLSELEDDKGVKMICCNSKYLKEELGLNTKISKGVKKQ